MPISRRTIVLTFAAALAGVGHGTGVAQNPTPGHEFELVGETARSGPVVRFAVRLTANGQAVADAAISVVDFNMTPEGMAGSNPVTALPPEPDRIQPFEARPEMSGRWELVLSARVPGIPDEVRGSLIVRVPD